MAQVPEMKKVGSPSTRTDAKRADRWAAILAFCLLIGLGLLVSDDFGITWDEPDTYGYGRLVFDSLKDGTRDFEQHLILRYYGPVIPLLHAVADEIIDPTPEHFFHVAHLLNFSVFVLGLAAFYGLCMRQFGSWRWALAGVAFLVTSPRIFSHAFLNPKDGPFLAIFIVNMYLLVTYLETGRLRFLLALGVATAILIDIRITGIFMLALALSALAADAFFSGDKERHKRAALEIPLYGASVVPLVILMWPFLWPDPIARFWDSFLLLSRFDKGPTESLYLGHIVSTFEPPWHYIPVWLGITTPVLYLVLGLLGLFVNLLRNPLRAFRQKSIDRHYYLYAGWLFGPPIAVVLKGSTLYDEWRQMNFIYPALILFAVAGGKAGYSWIKAKFGRLNALPTLFLVAIIVGTAATAFKMMTLHPFEALYFNQLVGQAGGAEGRFELDYYGVSYREGLRYLLERYPGRDLQVHGCTLNAKDSAAFFRDRERLQFVDLDQAEFGVCAPQDTMFVTGSRDGMWEFPTIHRLERDGATFLYVKDLR